MSWFDYIVGCRASFAVDSLFTLNSSPCLGTSVLEDRISEMRDRLHVAQTKDAKVEENAEILKMKIADVTKPQELKL